MSRMTPLAGGGKGQHDTRENKKEKRAGRTVSIACLLLAASINRNKLRRSLHRFFIEDPLTPVQVLCVVAMTLVIMIYGSLITNASERWAVLVGGRVVAVSSHRGELEDILRNRIYFGAREGHTLHKVIIRPASWGEGPVLSGRYLEESLARALGAQEKGTALVVNGDIKLVVASRDAANQLLETLKEQHSIPGADVRLVEKVVYKEVWVPAGEILSLREALEFAGNGGRRLEQYSVRAGDTLWDIAARKGIPVEELQAANPGLTPETLQVGQVLKLSRTEPLINVLATVVRTEKRELPFVEERRRDNRMLRGQQRVVQAGKPGVEEVTYRLAYLNGRLVNNEVLERKVLEEPRPRVVAVGSRVLLASRSGASGSLAWPAVGAIGSPHGPRWGRLHAGVDITAGSGAPVRSAEAGRVIRAGWNGGYGLMVDVYHGDGVVTRYAHLSRIEVRVGQRVERGQLLGRVGSTGNTTGPHLHFEVWINGRPVDPARFL
ncbi:MAG: peptidoglycan DD-metalloendopeptidase family protein [Thermoanaerobacter sp.]|nr:peptidoglycan DD-metalloendopeptidase family protein [Thermoanaerobacter sp.]